MTALAKLATRMTVREFLGREMRDGRRYELVDGAPRAMAPTSTVHGYLKSELARLIGNHLREHRPGCHVISNPGVVPNLLSAHNFRIPDLGVTCAPVAPAQASIPDPVLLIEILSPSNQADTWSNVWAYTSIPSLLEIRVLDSTRIAAETLRRTPEGSWPKEPAAQVAGDLLFSSIGFGTSLEELYRPIGLAA
jgi:Uma2 family endonuclease